MGGEGKDENGRDEGWQLSLVEGGTAIEDWVGGGGEMEDDDGEVMDSVGVPQVGVALKLALEE